MGLSWTEASNELVVIFINTAGRIKHMAWDKQLKTSSMYIWFCQQLPAKNQWTSNSHKLQRDLGPSSVHYAPPSLKGACCTRGPHLMSEHNWVIGQCCPTKWCNKWKALRRTKLPLGAINEPNLQVFNKYVAVLLHIKSSFFQLKTPLMVSLNHKC